MNGENRVSSLERIASVMQLALGRAESDEYKTNLHYVSEVCVCCSRGL